MLAGTIAVKTCPLLGSEIVGDAEVEANLVASLARDLFGNNLAALVFESFVAEMVSHEQNVEQRLLVHLEELSVPFGHGHDFVVSEWSIVSVFLAPFDHFGKGSSIEERFHEDVECTQLLRFFLSSGLCFFHRPSLSCLLFGFLVLFVLLASWWLAHRRDGGGQAFVDHSRSEQLEQSRFLVVQLEDHCIVGHDRYQVNFLIASIRATSFILHLQMNTQTCGVCHNQNTSHVTSSMKGALFCLLSLQSSRFSFPRRI